MSGLSSPSAWLTTSVQSTNVNLYSSVIPPSYSRSTVADLLDFSPSFPHPPAASPRSVRLFPAFPAFLPYSSSPLVPAGVGLTGLLAPAFASNVSSPYNPFKYAARGVSKPANTAVTVADVQASALATRLTASRDIVLGLLMRDTTAAVVVRALQGAFSFFSLCRDNVLTRSLQPTSSPRSSTPPPPLRVTSRVPSPRRPCVFLPCLLLPITPY